MSKRVFLIVLDSLGIGEMPDANEFCDVGSNTLRSISLSNEFNINTLKKLGLFNVDSIDFLSSIEKPIGAYGRLSERSYGKDTTIGHWEISGVVSDTPFPTYPNGFPDDIITEFKNRIGKDILCNKPYSGTEVIKQYGDEHMNTGSLIVYTSADSVFQIAAHEDIVPVDELYKYCEIARNILQGKHAVGRVIARPFIGCNGNYKRTSNRHDFSLEPPQNNMLNYIKNTGLDSIAIGKIFDIFAGCGFTEHRYTKSNDDGMSKTMQYLNEDFNGLCFVNLVDFDMIYGHRNDVDGYAKALSEFDIWLSGFVDEIKDEDLLIITADHGCDPGFKESNDHTREYVPLLIYGKKVKPTNLNTRNGFCDIGKTICDYLDVDNCIEGNSFLGDIYE